MQLLQMPCCKVRWRPLVVDLHFNTSIIFNSHVGVYSLMRQLKRRSLENLIFIDFYRWWPNTIQRQTRLVWDSCTALTARSQSGRPYLQINHETAAEHRQHSSKVRSKSAYLLDHQESDSRFHLTLGPSKSMASDMSQGQQLQSVVTDEPQRKPAIDAYSSITALVTQRNLWVAAGGPLNPNNLLLSCPACIWSHTASSPKLFLTMMEMLWCGHVPTTGTCNLEKSHESCHWFRKRKNATCNSACLYIINVHKWRMPLQRCQVLYVLYDSLSLFCICKASNWSKCKLVNCMPLQAPAVRLLP